MWHADTWCFRERGWLTGALLLVYNWLSVCAHPLEPAYMAACGFFQPHWWHRYQWDHLLHILNMDLMKNMWLCNTEYPETFILVGNKTRIKWTCLKHCNPLNKRLPQHYIYTVCLPETCSTCPSLALTPSQQALFKCHRDVIHLYRLYVDCGPTLCAEFSFPITLSSLVWSSFQRAPFTGAVSPEFD